MSKSKKTVKEYASELQRYIFLAGELPRRPHDMQVVGNTLYWTQSSLMHVPIDGDCNLSGVPVFNANCGSLFEEKKQLSKEEEMLRERMRGLTSGVSSFFVRESDGAIFYTSQCNLFVYYTAGPLANQPPLNIFSFIKDAELFLQDKPCLHISVLMKQGHPVTTVFVHNNNLYYAEIHEQVEKAEAPLQVSVTAVTTIGDEHHQCGVADYITQEEFSRYSGHVETSKYILFSYIDTSMMRTVRLLKDDTVEEMAYPRVGDENAKTTLVVYDKIQKRYLFLPECVIKKSISFEPEYIPRFGFKDEETIYLEALSRTQEECSTLSYPISSLLEITEQELLAVYSESGGKTKEFFPPMHVELEQSIPWAWVEILPGPPIYFGKRVDVTVRHAIESETAHYHLFFRPASGSATSWKPLTTGTWNVNPALVHVQEERITFVANAGGRLQQNLFTLLLPTNLYEEFAPLDEMDIIPVSQEGEHVISFCATKDRVFYCASTATCIAELREARFPKDGPSVPSRVIPTLPWIREQHKYSPASGQVICGGLPITVPTVVTVRNSRGVSISGCVYSPPSNAPSLATGRGAPLVLYVYGGPHVQLVFENDFEKFVSPAVQCLLMQGITVAVVDNQMSNANGLRALSVCKKAMGTFETSDYVCFVNELCNAPLKLGLPSTFKVDPDRVGIFGWSYGGYATLLALSQSNIFKMGFSGAPVGDWTLYDTGYTERYMGLLKDSKTGEVPSQAYKSSSIGHFASGFPDDVDRVYIAHGLLDENVHFVNSCHITSAMVRNEKPYSMLVYPGERHGLRQNKQSRYHHDAVMIKTFVEKL